jgi:hypothetical protein
VFVIASASFSATARFVRMCSVIAVTWAIASSLYVYPHSLSYFNEAAGGPNNGHFHILHGNLDAGQDLLYVRDWIERHPSKRPVYVASWGNLPFAQLGLDFQDPSLAIGISPPPGWYIVSVNHARGIRWLGRPELAVILQDEPVEQVSYTTYVYRVR